jgi:hypothetical protein
MLLKLEFMATQESKREKELNKYKFKPIFDPPRLVFHSFAVEFE